MDAVAELLQAHRHSLRAAGQVRQRAALPHPIVHHVRQEVDARAVERAGQEPAAEGSLLPPRIVDVRVP